MKTLAIAAATLAFSAAPALAGPEQLPTQKVSTAGIDLATPEGQAMLDRRIERAAREVCQVDAVRTGTRIRAADSVACLAHARASAQRQVATMIEDQRRGG
ncbi:UrcA family protein [Qipengyuania nanhaisediminis]|uniref:UrcA family protein n=1 Tax=Qipengyuania nanhaisediminis TaxID=604088 RepID=UPI0038B33134